MGKYLDMLMAEEKKKEDKELKEFLLKELRNENSNVVIFKRHRKDGSLKDLAKKALDRLGSNSGEA